MIKKLTFIALAFLFFVGIANATGIPEVVDPQNYPVVWTESVYNGTASTIQSGVIVSWDYTTSDSSVNVYDSHCPWIRMPTETDATWTAGVTVYGTTIATKTAGQIVIRGPAPILKGASFTADGLIGSTATTGATVDFAASADDCAVGRCIAAIDSNGVGAGYALVDVTVFCGD